MGCFDYECECGGKTCRFVGGQEGGDSTAVVEVPLQDGTTIFVKGDYNSYGAVEVGEYTFYPEQFHDCVKGWLSGESEEKIKKCFVAKNIWTLYYHDSEFYETRGTPHPSDFTTCVPNEMGYKSKIIKKRRAMLIPITTVYQ